MQKEIQTMCIHDDKNWSDAEEKAMIPKHISKIAPVMARHVELKDKDFVCIAQHLKEYRFKYIQREEFPNACYDCSYIKECKCCYEDTFLKISRITGVDWSGAEIMTSDMMEKDITHLTTVRGVNLSNKDFFCIGRHIKSFWHAYAQNTAYNPCTKCKYRSSCQGNGVTGDWAAVFIKWTRITGINCISETKIQPGQKRLDNANLIERDFQCIARRIQEFTRIVMFNEDSNEVLFHNCYTCPYKDSCYPGQMWDSFYRLAKITGVYMSNFAHAGKMLPERGVLKEDEPTEGKVGFIIKTDKLNDILRELGQKVADKELSYGEAVEEIQNNFHMIDVIMTRSVPAPKPY